ncbi:MULTISPECIES: hypothetical protein [Serratia]|jgi:hypothetical protein|uniref:Uncharacterized protein n=1 Tax=Serratia fonticola TaxID=47917 RepID=A0AAJ1YAX3_SERFO|nr:MULTISPECIES: hypothetical protein [Serratia]MDQ7212255.1 hypothetical protein [Serratia fonticola]MDQ9126554.1 hypothetical protein [Serratia fonticola]CAI2099586.1 Uncharacterised protein [Serratia fonticola]HBE9082378.1 hypothetical protein [Serratia fonticola]HBE9093043.1 hypothetical protein [Serratia fonticola]
MVTQQIISIRAIKGEIWGLTGGWAKGAQISGIAEFVRGEEGFLWLIY